jgi:hypothetical protein
MKRMIQIIVLKIKESKKRRQRRRQSMAQSTSAQSNIVFAAITNAALGLTVAGLVLAVGFATSLSSTSSAVAANVGAAAPLTISRKPPTDLSPAPGIRLAKISSNDGGTCFRASRALPNGGSTISETFCTH